MTHHINNVTPEPKNHTNSWDATKLECFHVPNSHVE